MNKQKELDFLFMEIAEKFAQLSHCVMYQVGCVLVKDERIISVGYNGTLPGMTNCDQIFGTIYTTDVQRERHYKLSAANEIHAEMNAIIYAAKVGIELENAVLYSTVKPCQHCMKNLLQAGIRRVVYRHPYDKDVEGETVNEFIKQNNIIVEQL